MSNICIVIHCLPGCGVLNFEINLINLSNQAAFSAWPKSQDKNLNILRTKIAFKIKYKTFFIIFEGLSLKQIIIFFGRWESHFKILINKVHNLSQKLPITFILFASMCTTHVSTWLVFSSDIGSLHLLQFALITCTRRQSIPFFKWCSHARLYRRHHHV